MQIGNRIQAFEWYYFQWPWTTPNTDLKVTSLFDAKYLNTSTESIRPLTGVISNDLEWLSEVLNDAEHHAVSLISTASEVTTYGGWQDRNMYTVIIINSRAYCPAMLQW